MFKTLPLFISLGCTAVVGCGDAASDVVVADAGTDSSVVDAQTIDSGDAAVVDPGAIGLNDVSVLFPRPSPDDDANTLRLSTAGNGGPLFEESHFNAISIFADEDSDDLSYGLWRIVAARIDPCFPSLALMQSNPSACRRQLRLIAQPILPAISPEPAPFIFVDSAIHLLYDLSESDFRALAAAFVALDGGELNDPAIALDVHPIMDREGHNGAYATALRALILEYAGTETLSQFTFMEGRTSFWESGGFVVTEAGLDPIEIHGVATDTETNGHLQRLTSEPGDNPFELTIGPTSISDALAPLSGELDEGGDFSYTASTEAMNEALRFSLRLEDPTTEFNPDTVDCASCHFAGRARARAIHLGASIEGMPRYESAIYNLDLTTEETHQTSLSSQRAFGFLRRDPLINQRVVNESVENALAIRALLAAQP